MQYQTILLELFRQHPALQRTPLTTLKACARQLKARHLHWTKMLGQQYPGSAPEQITSEALEIALQEVRDALPDDSTPNDPEVSLDAAMAYLRRHTPPA